MSEIRPGGQVLRVVVADDQTAVREGLVTILQLMDGIEVAGAASNGAQVVELAERLRPDVVLMDLRMPEVDGVEATRRVRASCPGTQVVVLTTYADDESVLEALGAGAIAFLTKDAGRADIRRALEAAASGQTVLDAGAAERLLRAAGGGGVGPGSGPGSAGMGPGAGAASATAAALRPGGVEVPLPDGLTRREAEVLVLMAEGLSNREIAARLYLGEVTVKTHVNRIFAKTGSRDRVQAISYARGVGLAD
ncbi:MAG TPA: response regulator transcription factor [Acidimicrobiales bacterium]|nr:response regulator transcription factor [Acidimicrobiales bacterium]